MFDHSLHDRPGRVARFHWLLLAFLAGSVNAGGYIACGRFVSHVTGFATLFGLDAATGRWDDALGILSVPLYFLMGVMISAYLIDRPYRRGKKPHYATVMSCVALCLILVAVLGQGNAFGVFGEPAHLRRDYFLLALLCAASGLQNAAITTATGATVRTTHLTGLTTDLGIGIIRAISVNPLDPAEKEKINAEWKAARFRVGTIGAFGMGSALGAVLYLRFAYMGFMLPAAIAIYFVIVAALTGDSSPIEDSSLSGK